MAIRVQKRKNRHNRARLKFVRGLFMRNFTALVVIAFVAASVFGLVRLYKFMMTSRYFAVKKINVFGTRHSYTDDIIVLSGITAGENIFSFSSDKAAEQIKNHPWIKKVSVNKHFPDRVSIDVTEYTPVMFINFSQLYLIDENAIVFKKLEPDELFDFPVISGISKEDYLNRTEYYRQKILTIYEIVQKFEKQFPYITLSEILLEKDGEITLIAAKNVFEIRLGQGNYDKKLSMLETILSEARNSDINPEIVYLNINREGIYAMKTKQRK